MLGCATVPPGIAASYTAGRPYDTSLGHLWPSRSGAKSVFMVLWTEVSHTEPRVPTQCRGRKSWHFCHSAEGLTSSLEGTMKCHQCHWKCKNGCSELLIEACNSSWKIEWHLQRGQVFREVGEFVHPSRLKSWIARHPVTLMALMSSWMSPEKKEPSPLTAINRTRLTTFQSPLAWVERVLKTSHAAQNTRSQVVKSLQQEWKFCIVFLQVQYMDSQSLVSLLFGKKHYLKNDSCVFFFKVLYEDSTRCWLQAES